MKKECFNCAWLSDKYVSICCNKDSHKCADFVDGDYVCKLWEEGTPPETPDEWKNPKEEK